VGDKGECEFTIGKGVGPIYVGGETGGCGLTVGSEVPTWLRWLHTGAGVAGAICLFAAGGWAMAMRGVAYIVPRLLLGQQSDTEPLSTLGAPWAVPSESP